MKLFTKMVALISITAASSAYAQKDYSGHRIGFGIVSSEVDHLDSDFSRSDLGSGLKLEYGYDINRIFGINISSDTSKDDNNFEGFEYETKVSTIKVDSDIGYAFFLNKFDIKPYGAIGLARVEEKITVHSGSIKSNSTSLLLGTGVRANFNFGLYSDLRFNFIMMDDYDIDQLSLTVGYKF
ncbi:porin family protein [Vibrio bathopelagicus]|uniref:porin family protein n=1 Tax=Vibrio bathopelagicus TaxID=2777577 RepID=UPI001864C866|nr:porin family protein [Vibrio bathopelagicus]